jgi:SAM-dependent methyltransferase
VSEGAETYRPQLADIYDAIYAFKDYDRETAHLVELLHREHPQARTLLEVACGSGLYLQRLAPHFQVEGLDLSNDMLARAAQRVPGVPLHQADMADFALPRRFDVVCCLFRSIAYVRTRERFRAAIACMAAQLATGGLLVVEPFFTPASYRDRSVVLNEFRDERMKVSWMYTMARPAADLGVFDIHYLVGTADGVDHFTESHALGLFDEQDYAEAFAAVGLVLSRVEDASGGTGVYLGRRG